MNTLGEQIKKLRKSNKLTQQQLANVLGVDQSSVSYYEQNKKMPDIETLDKLATHFDVTLDMLVYARNISATQYTQTQGRVVREVEENKEITADDLKGKFSLLVDGRPATDEEIEDAMRYIAIQRMMKEKKD